jgi:hypothetical protein
VEDAIVLDLPIPVGCKLISPDRGFWVIFKKQGKTFMYHVCQKDLNDRISISCMCKYTNNYLGGGGLHTITEYVRFAVFTAVTMRMASSGMLRREALVSTDGSEELSAVFIRVTRICELGTTLTVSSNRRTLRRNFRNF